MKNSVLFSFIFALGFLFGMTDLEVDGFSQLGSGAPHIKMKKLTSNTSGSSPGATTVAHGLNAAKILSVQIVINDGGLYLSDQFDNGPSLGLSHETSIYWDGTNINVVNHDTNSTSVTNKPFTLLVIYEA